MSQLPALNTTIAISQLLNDPTREDTPPSPAMSPTPTTPTCSTCALGAANPYPSIGITPGPLYTLPCTHTHCRSCLTSHHAAKGPNSLYTAITCPLCTRAAAFLPRQTFESWPQYLTATPDASDFSPGDRFILDPHDARLILAGLAQIPSAHSDAVEAMGLSGALILNTLDAYLANSGPSRLATPVVLTAELQEVVLGDLVYEFLVRREGAPHRMLARYLDTGENESDWRRQAAIVRAVRGMHPELEALVARWECVVAWCVAVVARRWWGRFG
jgi:hypothetical protein